MRRRAMWTALALSALSAALGPPAGEAYRPLAPP